MVIGLAINYIEVNKDAIYERKVEWSGEFQNEGKVGNFVSLGLGKLREEAEGS